MLTTASQLGLQRYVARLLRRRMEPGHNARVEVLDGTFVFIDVSGFTKLSERLQRVGREGAEVLVDSINTCFTALLADTHLRGGSLVKFGGDALLLWFEGDGHALRGCDAAAQMRRRLREVGRLKVGSRTVTLRMSVGVHSGSFHTFLVGGDYCDLIVAGPDATTLIELEGAAEAGQILISPQTATALPAGCIGQAIGPGVLLARTPPDVPMSPLPADPVLSPEDAEKCMPPDVLRAVRAGEGAAEHRTATVAFIEYREFDELIAAEGAEEAGRRLDEFVQLAQRIAAEQRVCLIDSDIGAGGGKLRLTAGAPVIVGDDEERLLLVLRRVIDEAQGLTIRAGVNRGPVFTGEIGHDFRRTYVVMGDTVNLAARVMGKSLPGTVLATHGVLERSQTKFETTPRGPFMMKGKRSPVDAWELGAAKRGAAPAMGATTLPLIGREAELARIREAAELAFAGSGRLLQIVGEVGSGKSRLLAELRDIAPHPRFVQARCELYLQGTPFAMWREPLRQLLGLGWDDSAVVVGEALRATVADTDPDLLPWLPLLAVPFDAEVAPTPEVDALAAEARVTRLHEAVVQFLLGRDTSQASAALVQIEDTHLEDAASAALLGALEARLGESRYLFVTTRRAVPGGFVAAEDSPSIELGPLSEADMMALAEATPEAHVLPFRVLEHAVAQAGGSPEFLMDLLAAAASSADGELPESIEAAASAWIDTLDPGDRTLVRRAAVLGLSFHPERLEYVLGRESLPDERVWRRLSEIFELEADGLVRFKRPAVREAAYRGLPFKLRRALHVTVGQALEAAGDEDVDPGVLSMHFMLAGDSARAWRYALAAAERAVERYAPGDAVTLYRRAIEAARGAAMARTDLARAWEALGESLRLTGEQDEASAAFNAARKLTVDDPLTQARLFLGLARAADGLDQPAAVVRWANRGLRALEATAADSTERMRALLVTQVAVARNRQGKNRQAVELCRSAIALADATGEQHALARAMYVLDMSLQNLGRFEEADHAQHAVNLFRLLGDREQEANALNVMGATAYYRGRWDQATESYQQCAETWASAGNQGGAGTAEVNLGEVLSDQGHLDLADLRLRRAERMFRSMGQAAGLNFAQVLQARRMLRVSAGNEAIELLREAASEARARGIDATFADTVLAEAVASAGDPLLGLEMARAIPASGHPFAAAGLRAQAVAQHRAGHREEADRLAHQAIAVARAAGGQYDLAVGLDLLDAIVGLMPEEAQELSSISRALGLVMIPRPWVQEGSQTPPATEVGGRRRCC